jgi:hypothetical protein
MDSVNSNCSMVLSCLHLRLQCHQGLMIFALFGHVAGTAGVQSMHSPYRIRLQQLHKGKFYSLVVTLQ